MPRVVEVAGQRYEFPDDAPDEAVMAFVNKHAPKPATTMDVLKAVPSNVLNNLAQSAKGSLVCLVTLVWRRTTLLWSWLLNSASNS